MNMQQMILVMAGLLFSFSLNARECREVHRTANPESLYLALKLEEWKYHPIPLREAPRLFPLPESLREQLLAEHKHKFDLAELSSEDMTRFYLNTLRTDYIQAANLWKRREVRLLTGGRHERFATHLLEQLMSIKNLNDPDLNPSDVRQILSEKKWREFPWDKSIGLIDAFETSGIPYSRSNLISWMEQQNHGLTSGQASEIVRAYEQSKWKRSPLCCLSTPGCHFCPANRRWMRNR